MLSAHCSRHGTTVLVPTSRIEAVESLHGSHAVRWRCSCGTRQTTLVPGRRAIV
jgi:hypothetical protein